MARFDEAFIQAVREKSEIVDLVSEYVRLEKRGGRYWGLCPFHSEKTPSFSVRPDAQVYHCFGCKASGDVITFVREKERLEFTEALEFLARRAQVPIPQPERTPEQAAAAQGREQVLKALEFAAQFYQYHLRRTAPGRQALSYLYGRGLTDEIIDRFRIGYAPQGWDQLLRSAQRRGIAPPTLVDAGLVAVREGGGHYDRFRNRVMFPIGNARGRVLGFGGRALSDEQRPKYYNSPEGRYFNKRLLLFALDLAKESMRTDDFGIVVEGYMDAIALHQAGFPQAVASLGTSLTQEQAQLLRRQCSKVIIAYDADIAGQEATQRGLDVLVRAGCDVRVLRLPAGKDPDDLVRQGGPEAFRRALEQAEPLTEFKLRQALSRHGGAGNSAETKARAIQEVLPLLTELRDFAVLQDEYIKRVARALDISEEGLRTDVRRHLGQRKVAGHADTISRFWNNRKVMGSQGAPARQALPRPDGLIKAEREVLLLILHHSHLREQAQQEMSRHAWKCAEHAVLYQALLQVGTQGVGVAALMGSITDPEARRLVAELLEEAHIIRQPERELEQSLARLRREQLRTRRREIHELLKNSDRTGEPVAESVILELQAIDQQLAR